MTAQPTGTVTFLFTDLEGSTKLWERYPTGMRAALKRHDEILRHAIRAHRGYVFKTIGDAFCAAFANPVDAVAAADMAQRLLNEEPWGETGPLRARMAIHTGEPEARDGDYFGQPVNRVARLLAIGHGQQVLLSEATRELVVDRLPSGSQLRARGKHRLKDLNLPQPVFQLLSTDWPVNLKELKSLPSPVSGAVAALGTGGITVASYAVRSRTASEGVGTSLLSPASLYTSFKGLLIDLSALNERFLLGAGLLLLVLCVAVALARRWQLKREESLRTPEGGRVFNWVVNQRTFTFLAVLAVVALGAYAYQQYLWRVALPIPEDATGFAITREASAASFQNQLADTLFTQGQAGEIVIRELPVVFDASDTERARELGTRINAEAVIIYRVDEAPRDESERYVAYVVFTDPNIGLVLGAPGDTQGPGLSLSTPPVQVKEGVPVPVLKTPTLEELVNAAAGIIDYNEHRIRDAIEHLEQAVPPEAGAANTGIVQFYLGNAHQIDGNAPAAIASLESAATFYAGQAEGGEIGAQDALILLKAYAKLGEIAWMQGDEEGALAWFDKGLPLREDLVSRADGLERPSDVPATYARLYTFMADTYEALDRPEDEAFWQERAIDELGRVAGLEAADDPYPLLQEANARFFMGQCVPAADAFARALALDPDNLDAQTGAGIVAFFQGRHDLAMRAWQQIIDQHPDAIQPRVLIANVLVLRGITNDYTEIGDLLEAERLLGEVIALDPTNVAAHDTIADLALIRAQSAMLDSTALAQGDDLSFNKSQAAWIHQPHRQQEALDAYSVVIEQRRVIASELRAGDPSSAAEVATAYAGREDLLFSFLLNDAIMRASGEPDNATPSATPLPAAGSWDEMLLADGEQIVEWSGRVLDDPDAPRLAVLEAHAARVGALQHVWFWSAYIAPDEERAAAAAEDFREAVAEGIAFGEMEPPGVDEIPPLRLIYFAAQSLAMFFDDDADAAAELEGKIADLTSREMSERVESTTNLLTTCDEVRETAAGDAASQRGDTTEAMARYDAALGANPDHVAALLGAGKIRFGEGDLEGAIAMAERATGISTSPAAAWADLALYRTASGDLAGAREAYDRFFTLLADQGPQSRLFAVGQALENLDNLWEDEGIDTAGMRESLSLFASFLDGMVDDATGSYQYAALYARLGGVALRLDSPDDAEAWLRRALELDPHQPATYADLVVAVAMREGDPDAVIAMALDEARDPLWTATVDYDAGWVLDEMDEAAVSLRETFPDQAPALDAFTDAIEAARS